MYVHCILPLIETSIGILKRNDETIQYKVVIKQKLWSLNYISPNTFNFNFFVLFIKQYHGNPNFIFELFYLQVSSISEQYQETKMHYTCNIPRIGFAFMPVMALDASSSSLNWTIPNPCSFPSGTRNRL